MPAMPLRAAGVRIEPPASDPSAPRQNPAATAAPDPLLECPDKLGGKSSGKRWKWLVKHHAHHLPVACDGILTSRRFGHSPKSASWRLRCCATKRHEATQPERTQDRQPQRDTPGHVAERIAPAVTVSFGIGQRTDPDAVEHDHENAREWRHARPRTHGRGDVK